MLHGLALLQSILCSGWHGSHTAARHKQEEIPNCLGTALYLCIQHDSTENPCVAHGLPQGVQSLLKDTCGCSAQVTTFPSTFGKTVEPLINSNAATRMWHRDAKDAHLNARSGASVLAVSCNE